MGNLISTYDVLNWLGVPEGDANTSVNDKIESLTLAVEGFADGYTMRKLAVTQYTAPSDYVYLDGNGLNYIYLPQYPVSSIAGSVYVDNDREWDSGAVVPSKDLVVDWRTGKIYSEYGYFYKGHRNVYIGTYTAGYAPIVGGTHDSAVSTYPIPYDLKQVLVEMAALGFKEGLSMIRAVEVSERLSFINLLTQNGFWKQTLDRYKSPSATLGGYWE